MIHFPLSRYFTEAVFDIHNSINVTVNNCSFTDNYGSGIINEPYRGNTGALSITYSNMNSSATNPFVIVSDTFFKSNSAFYTNDTSTGGKTFSIGVLKGRAGGMAVFVNENNFNVNATIEGCYFYQNFASYFGGGMYILFNGGGSHTAYINNNTYEGNEAENGGGGGLMIADFVTTQAYNSQPNSYHVERCKFISNVAMLAGGMYFRIRIREGISLNSLIHIENSFFIQNKLLMSKNPQGFGAALVIARGLLEYRKSFHANTIKNWYFKLLALLLFGVL